MKALLKRILQKLLGMDNYLILFSNFIIYTLPLNRKERDFLHFVKLIKSDGLILDIGANIGIMTYYLSRKKHDSKIIAFEPVPMNIAALQKIIQSKRLKNVLVKSFALGNKNTEAKIVMPEIDKVKMQGLSHIVHESISDFNEGKTYNTQIVRLDDMSEITDNELPLVAIKMDVENFEYFVLEGGINTISKYRPLIYTELWDNENRSNCFKLLTKLNYKTQIIEKGQLIDFDPLKHSSQNFFFIP